jgi:hypothetical protein
MRKRSGLLLAVLFLALVSLPFTSGISAAADPITLKALTAWPKNASDNKSLDFFM